MFLSSLIDGFLLDCKARRLSPDTVKRAYAPPLRDLCDRLNNPQVKQISTDDLRAFIADVSERNHYARGNHPWMTEQPDKPLSSWTVHRHVRMVKRLFNWALKEGIIDDNPAKPLEYPQVPKRPRVEIFSKSEIKQLLKESLMMSYRNFALVFLLLDSGIRREELCSLTTADVNIVTGVVTIRHGKGDKQRAVRVGDGCRKALWRYVAQYRQAGPGVNTFFVNRYGKPLSGNAVCQMLRRLGERTGLHVYAHKFRHTFATLFAVRVPNALLLADALGHSDLKMAKWYVHLSGTQSTDVDLSPMDWLLNE